MVLYESDNLVRAALSGNEMEELHKHFPKEPVVVGVAQLFRHGLPSEIRDGLCLVVCQILDSLQ